MMFQLNQQYMIEGFTAGFMMLMSGVGFIILDLITRASTTRYQNTATYFTGISMLHLPSKQVLL